MAQGDAAARLTAVLVLARLLPVAPMACLQCKVPNREALAPGRVCTEIEVYTAPQQGCPHGDLPCDSCADCVHVYTAVHGKTMHSAMPVPWCEVGFAPHRCASTAEEPELQGECWCVDGEQQELRGTRRLGDVNGTCGVTDAQCTEEDGRWVPAHAHARAVGVEGRGRAGVGGETEGLTRPSVCHAQPFPRR
jgi:hypothetical protein